MKIFKCSDYAQRVTCQPDADQHCLTCSDEGVAVRVVYIEPSSGIAFVEVGNQTEEVGFQALIPTDNAPGELATLSRSERKYSDEQRDISARFIREEVDITLVEDVAPGDLLLVHGGVAIARLEGGEANVN
jgi:hydrogenase maturation factor